MEFAQFNMENIDEMTKLLMDSYNFDSAGPYGDHNASTQEIS